MDQAALRKFIENKFADRKITLYPFPHMLIENFFPDDVFRQIQEYNLFTENSGSEWISQEKSQLSSNLTPFHLRKQINLHKDLEFNAPGHVMQFWKDLHHVFVDDGWFIKLVFRTFPEYFELRFGPAVRDKKFLKWLNVPFFVQRHDDDYFLGPHTDNANRIFTCLFSFADQPGYEEYGTQLLVHKDPFAISTLGRHHDWDEFEVVKIAEYRPNNFFMFFKTAHSFHAVKRIDKSIPNKRYGMQLQCSERRAALFRQLPLASEEKAAQAVEAKARLGLKLPADGRPPMTVQPAQKDKTRHRVFGMF